ncbi:Uncharacterized protein dnm_074290 [Desulfonema magnum]|uniref:Uncharacterized protein n=1 Tax=Desulfonema magnum TaxID=45655 RepID=A0A975GRT6_9BACT|nr:Uncharacterized protein dnm_074290 [Desulfonema magnum]
MAFNKFKSYVSIDVGAGHAGYSLIPRSPRRKKPGFFPVRPVCLFGLAEELL